MAHDSYLMWMSLDLDGELAEPDRAALRQHLRSCAACSAAWDRLSLIDRSFAVQPEVAPRLDFSARVMGRVAAHQARQRWYPWFLAGLIGIVVAAVVSLALPLAVVALGLYKPLLDLPVISTLVGYAANMVTLVGTLGDIAGRDLLRWLRYLTTDPVSLAVVITALSAAAMWIGLREVTRQLPVAEPAQQSA